MGELGARVRKILLKKNVLLVGSFISEASLWIDAEHGGDVFSTLQSSLLVVNAIAFTEGCGAYPRLQSVNAVHASRFLQGYFDGRCKSIDLLDSSYLEDANPLFYNNKGEDGRRISGSLGDGDDV